MSGRVVERDHFHFFKVYIPEHSSEKMKIPSRFVYERKGEKGKYAYLDGPSRELWRVRFVNCENDWLFRKGWNVILKDHALAFADYLVFRYDGSMKFEVPIFKRSGCGKETAFKAKCSQVKGNGLFPIKISFKVGRVSLKKRSRGRPHEATADEQRVAASITLTRPFLVRSVNWKRGKYPQMHLPTKFFLETSGSCTKSTALFRNTKGNCWSVNLSDNRYV